MGFSFFLNDLGFGLSFEGKNNEKEREVNREISSKIKNKITEIGNSC